MGIEVIAEIGINHNRSVDQARVLIDAAIMAGADTAKFQCCIPELETSMRAAPEHARFIRDLMLGFNDLLVLKRHCEDHGIRFLVTPGDTESLKFLLSIEVARLKISSDNLPHVPMLRTAAASGKPLIVSTGMASMAGVGAAFTVLHEARDRLTFLHCTSLYPCPEEKANLRAIITMRDLLKVPIGWSDHT